MKKELLQGICELLKDVNCHKSFLDGYQNGCPNEHYNQAIVDVLSLISGKEYSKKDTEEIRKLLKEGQTCDCDYIQRNT